MPPETKCPYCATIIPDWHFEWHAELDQREIFEGTKAMECPACRTGVAFDGFSVSKANSQQILAKRNVAKAARWARIQNKSLNDYLQTREGEPFKNFWTPAEVEVADGQSSAEVE